MRFFKGRVSRKFFTALLFLWMAGAPAIAQTYPTGTVRVIVAFAPGGTTDTMARLVSQGLSELWGYPVVVENRPGAAQVSAVQAVSRSAPDGYTLLVTADTTVTANPALYSKLPYDATRDLTPIIPIGDIMPVLAANAALPFRTFADVLAYAKANPGKLSYGSPGIGTYNHLSMEDIKRRMGIDILHVPYKGSAPSVTALTSGEISLLLANISTVEAFEKSGKTRILASAGKGRIPARNELPTIAEYGLPGFYTGSWFGMFGPANMPAALVQRIHADASRILDAPKTRQFFSARSYVRMDKTPSEFSQLIQEDLKHWEALIKATGTNLD